MHSNSNPRASLLSGLRTGGVRSASQPSIVPHTAAVGGSFNIPRHPSFAHQPSHFPEDETDELAEMIGYSVQLNGGGNNHRMMPATAGPLDGNRFQQQQQAAFLQQMAAQRSVMTGMGIPGMGAVDPMQMQLMQLELMKLQAIQQAQQQQFQVELMAQTQRQQMMQQQQQQQQRAPRRASTYGEPVTAGPGQTSFDLRGSAQYARNQGDIYDQETPKTAALGGKFGGRPVLSALNPHATVFTMNNADEPSTPKTATPGNQGRTTVISGGTSLGGISLAVHTNNGATTAAATSKSDLATSWRRPNGAVNNDSPLTPTRPSGTHASLTPVRLTPGGDHSPAPSPLRSRPTPLRFNDATNGVPSAEFEASSESDLDSYVSGKVRRTPSTSSTSDGEKDSSPSTPPSASSNNSLTREEASKRLYEGLGMGRPVQLPGSQVHIPLKQQVTQVIRQPRGPPASVDELGPRNFAARMQKKLVAAA